MEILVSEEDKWILTEYKWYINNGYVMSTRRINGKMQRMHRFLMIDILGNDLTKDDIVDHINSIRHDNRRENLRVVTRAENARNRGKHKNSSSDYYGVCKYFSMFKATLYFNKEIKYAYYKNELHAAFQYDLWIKQYQISNIKINNIEKPQDFVEYEKKKKQLDLPKNIFKSGEGFQVGIYGKYYGWFKTLELAEEQLNQVKLQLENERINQILNTSIKRNSDDIAIICVQNKEILVDDDVYYNLIIIGGISISMGYAYITINYERIRLHRYIMDYYKSDCLDYVDHINGNKLDNRKSNLRIVTPKQNAMNQGSNKNATSEYVGVYKNKNDKWVASIKVDGETIPLGNFDCEIEAAKKRDEATLKYCGENGRLNFQTFKS